MTIPTALNLLRGRFRRQSATTPSPDRHSTADHKNPLPDPSVPIPQPAVPGQPPYEQSLISASNQPPHEQSLSSAPNPRPYEQSLLPTQWQQSPERPLLSAPDQPPPFTQPPLPDPTQEIPSAPPSAPSPDLAPSPDPVPDPSPDPDRQRINHPDMMSANETIDEQPALTSLPVELRYLDQLIRYRLAVEFQPASAAAEPVMPPYHQWELPIGQFITDYNLVNDQLTADEARLLLIGLVYHVQPDLFDHSIDSMLKGAGDFPRIGGARGKNFRGFMPTGETALFLLAGEDWKRRLAIQQLFWADHVFARKKMLWLEDIVPGEPAMSGKITLSQDYVEIFTHNKTSPPHFSMSFPARLITTDRDRKELVINSHLNSQIEDLLDWIKFKAQVTKGGEDGQQFRNGYRSLFYGPSGTGKTFAACILGKETGKEVYRIDLSMVVSKYIGETEKNLEVLFARAENKKWILFFDEADALFGKRTNIRDAHDKYANQEVSYLLQRIEDYDGLVILATNMKNNIDEAFIRRFNSVLKFQMPDAEERKKIWKNIFPKGVQFKKDLPAADPKPTPDLKPTADPDPSLNSDSSLNPNTSLNLNPNLNLNPSPGISLAGPDPLPIAPARSERAPDIPELVKKYVLSGGNIENIVHYASIKGAKRQSEHLGRQTSTNETPAQPDPGNDANPSFTIYLPDVIEGIRRELGKDGIPFV